MSFIEAPMNNDKLLTYRGRMYVLSQINVKQCMLDEFHRSPYDALPDYQKIFSTKKKDYFWHGMRKDIGEYLAKCLECQQVKAENQHLVGFLHPLPILEWKWDTITLDFIK